jgi:catechol 2,3-dioxygenase-like lactoylglutathione lyase family enzyme
MPTRRVVIDHVSIGVSDLARGAFVLDPDGHNIEAVHHG